MSRIVLSLFAAAGVLLFSGCGSSDQAHDHDHDHGHDHAHHDHDHDHAHDGDSATAVASKLSTNPIEGGQTLELGCAGCIYELEGAEGCETAVKVGDKVLMLTGFELDAHSVGLCKSAKAAEVAGSVDGANFVASAVRMLPAEEAAPVAE